MMVERLDLGLSLSLSSAPQPNFPFPSSSLPFPLRHNNQPSNLLLSPVEAQPPPVKVIEEEEEEGASSSSPNSALSSLSGEKRLRQERELSPSGSLHRLERTGSRGISDEEDGDGDGDGSRKKLRLSKDQSAVLEECFKEHNTLNPKQKVALAKQLNLRPRQVEVWFQNRRARTKLKQTEMDCEHLKRWCESLTEENRRLQRELAELRALKSLPPPPPPPAAMQQLSPHSVTMCPSCQRVVSPSKSSTPAASGAHHRRHDQFFPASAHLNPNPWAVGPFAAAAYIPQSS